LCGPRGGVETLPRPPVEITLFQCIAKPARMDWLLEKAVELGVSRIVPIISAHAVVRVDPGVKQERWQRIAEAALRQCACGWMTEIEAPLKWSDALARMGSFQGKLLVGALIGETRSAGDVLMEMRDRGFRSPVGWLIGPEGDLSAEELAAAVSIARAIPVSFGTQVLRVETAAVFGVSAAVAVLG
jgi:16S rRNA (uracil1498-N3)-methyltransferase